MTKVLSKRGQLLEYGKIWKAVREFFGTTMIYESANYVRVKSNRHEFFMVVDTDEHENSTWVHAYYVLPDKTYLDEIKLSYITSHLLCSRSVHYPYDMLSPFNMDYLWDIVEEHQYKWIAFRKMDEEEDRQIVRINMCSYNYNNKREYTRAYYVAMALSEDVSAYINNSVYHQMCLDYDIPCN